MKIVHIITELYTGGAEKFCIDLCNELSLIEGNEVFLCVLGDAKNSMLYKKLLPSVKCVSLKKEKGYDLKVVQKLFDFLKEIQPDVSHTHLRAQAYSFLPLIRLSISNVHTVHNLAYKEIGKPYRFLYKILYNFFNFTPVAISHEVLESIQKEYGKKFNKLVYNGTKEVKKSDIFESVKEEINILKKHENTKVFVHIGRFGEQKNQKMLIETFEELISENFDILLLMIGYEGKEGTPAREYYNECKKLVKSKDRIFFMGEKSNIGDYLFLSDAMVLSSKYEGLPIVVLEAMSAGKAVITTPAGGVVDVIEDGVNGYMAEGFDKISFLKAIKKFLLNPLIDRNKIKSIFDKKYSIKHTAKEYMKIYKELVEL